MPLFKKNFLEITLAGVEVEIKHLNIYLKPLAQATLIHVSTVLQPRAHASLGCFSGTLLAGIPFGYYLILFLHVREEEGKPWSCKGVKHHGQSPSRTVCFSLASTLATPED